MFKSFLTLFALSFSILQAGGVPASVPVFHPLHPLPSVQFQVERVNVEHSVPMYGPKLVSAVSSLSQPPDNLLHHCYAHLYLKVSICISQWFVLTPKTTVFRILINTQMSAITYALINRKPFCLWDHILVKLGLLVIAVKIQLPKKQQKKVHLNQVHVFFFFKLFSLFKLTKGIYIF